LTIQTEKGVNYHQTDVPSNLSLASVKETRSLDNIFMFRESEKGLKKTPGGYFSQLIQTRLKSINVVSSDVAFRFQSELERQQSMLILGVPRVRPRVMVHQTNEAQYRNHDRTNKDSRA
jgi:hypothetical protein